MLTANTMPFKPWPASLFYILPAATTGIILSSYFFSISPLSSSTCCKSPRYDINTYQRSDTLSPSTLASKSLRTVNPRRCVQGTDSRSVVLDLVGSRVGERDQLMGDEEVLARFTRGFFGGWVFVPEKGILRTLRAMGRQLARVGFTDVPDHGPEILSPYDLPPSKLPEKYTRLLGGNFMVLDHHIQNFDEGDGKAESSFIDIAFGDDRGGFSGMHRFELLREGEGKVRIWYSCMTCNPSTVDKLPFPGFVYTFHEVYAERLFWDGVRGVLS